MTHLQPAANVISFPRSQKAIAAQQMGHSLAIHSDLYHAWITERRHRQMFEAIMGRSDRPQAPL